MLKIYAVKDNAVDAFSQPFYSPTNGSALRAFADHVNEKGTPANKHARDFSLYCIGTFDEHTGSITGTTPERLGTAEEYLTKE